MRALAAGLAAVAAAVDVRECAGKPPYGAPGARGAVRSDAELLPAWFSALDAVSAALDAGVAPRAAGNATSCLAAQSLLGGSALHPRGGGAGLRSRDAARFALSE